MEYNIATEAAIVDKDLSLAREHLKRRHLLYSRFAMLRDRVSLPDGAELSSIIFAATLSNR
jgi:hypothetical protein